MTSKTELFAAYGDDVDLALSAWPNLDPQGYGAWSANCERRQYLSDYRRWYSRQTIDAARPTKAQPQSPLFDTPAGKVPTISVRAGIVHDGQTIDLASLTGHDGARKLREAALRDIGPAETTVDRCRYYLDVAKRVDEQTEAEGRPVPVSEVMHLVASAA